MRTRPSARTLTAGALAAALSVSALAATTQVAAAESGAVDTVKPPPASVTSPIMVNVRGDQITLYSDIVHPDPARNVTRIEWRTVQESSGFTSEWRTVTGPITIHGYDVPPAEVQYRWTTGDGTVSEPVTVRTDHVPVTLGVATTVSTQHGRARSLPVTVTQSHTRAFEGRVYLWDSAVDSRPTAVAQASAGRATLTLPATLDAGTHGFRVSSRDDRLFASSSKWITVKVAKARSKTRLASAKPAKKARVKVKVTSTAGVQTPGTVTATVTKRVEGKRVVVATRRATLSKAGVATVKLPKKVRNQPGRYRLVVTHTGSKNVKKSSSKAVTWRVR